MKPITLVRTILAAFIFLVTSCASHHPIKGTASDRTGTNGATNGTGKVMK